jgi:hypothetical protein
MSGWLVNYIVGQISTFAIVRGAVGNNSLGMQRLLQVADEMNHES